MQSKFSLNDKVAIVTGSGGGIGQAIALGFAAVGAHVVVAELNPEAAAATAAAVESKGRRALKVAADVLQSGQVEQMVRQTMDEFGRIDILVNNVGGMKGFEPILGMSEEVWDDIFDLNVKSAFLCSKVVGKAMIDGNIDGRIINLSSIGGFSNRPNLVHYGAVKAAIRLFTDGLAKEWAPYGIRVNAIAPGYLKTALSAKVYEGNPSLYERRMKLVPLGRQGSLEEIAAVAVFLASDASSYITGQTILVAGGLDSLVEPREEV